MKLDNCPFKIIDFLKPWYNFLSSFKLLPEPLLASRPVRFMTYLDFLLQVGCLYPYPHAMWQVPGGVSDNGASGVSWLQPRRFQPQFLGARVHFAPFHYQVTGRLDFAWRIISVVSAWKSDDFRVATMGVNFDSFARDLFFTVERTYLNL